MASTYSNLKIELIGTGEQTNTWGATTNVNLGTAIEEAIVGSADVTFSSANVTLTLSNSNSSQTARNLRLNLTGTSGGARTLTVPNIEKNYIINNGLADTVTVGNSAGTTVAVPAGKTMWVYSTGSGVKDVTTHLSSLTLGTDLAVADGGTGASTASDARTNLGLVIGTDVQAYDADLTAIGALAKTDGNFIVGNGTTWVAESGSTARTSLGLGTIATQDASSVSITGGSITGITDLAVADGGTGASTAANARTNLGLVIGTDVQAYDADLTAIGALAKTDGNFIVGNGTTWVAESGATARTSLGLGSIATQAASSVSITGGSITGITDLAVADGGTGASTFTANNVLLGNGTSAFQTVAPGTSGNVLTSNGTTWSSAAIPTAFVTGMIMLWSGSIVSIPSGWALCDGTNGTPNLEDRFVVGAGNSYAVGATGGSANAIVVSHSHTATSTSAVSDPGHSHTITSYSAQGANSINSAGNNTFASVSGVVTQSASTGITVGTTTTVDSAGSSGTNANLPPYYALAYIMKL